MEKDSLNLILNKPIWEITKMELNMVKEKLIGLNFKGNFESLKLINKIINSSYEGSYINNKFEGNG